MGLLEDLFGINPYIADKGLQQQQKNTFDAEQYYRMRAAQQAQQQVYKRPGYKYICTVKTEEPARPRKHVDSIDVTEREKRKQITGEKND